MAQTSNFTWDQGADLDIQMIYKEGATVETAVVVDLSTGYSLRMDIVNQSDKARLYTFNTASIADVDDATVGSQPDSVVEGTLTSGAGGTPNITISVPRALTLFGGVLYDKLVLPTPVTVFNYDVFLRATGPNKQAKILTGTITVVPSFTLWLP